jgi:NAD(P)-dependent dehydrogenase (short-subunit alcohol dehydrogenase family)
VLHEGGSWQRKLELDEAAVMSYIDSEVPMMRFGSPVEIAKAVAFLASDGASGFTTGANLFVDGGQTRLV